MKALKKLAGALLAACLLTPAFAQVQEVLPGDDLANIKSRGVVRLGVRDSSIPLSYKLPNGEYVGLAVDLCTKVAQEIQKDVPGLKIEYVLVTSATRFTALANSAIDMECGSTSNTPERRKAYEFSIPYYVSKINGLVSVDSNVFTIYDITDDNSFVFTKGTSTKAALINNGFKVGQILQHGGVTISEGIDHADSFKVMKLNAQTVYFNDDSILMGLAAHDPNPKQFRLVQGAANVEPYGVVTRKNASKLNALVNRTIHRTMVSGEFDKLYAKWFTSPIAPHGANLNFPMGQELRAVVRFPSNVVGN